MWASILGTIQSTLTNFRYLRKVWKDNAEEERLIGVSMTGIMDHQVLNGNDFSYVGEDTKLVDWLKQIKEEIRIANEFYADKLGINKSKQLSLLKPSGTVSQLCSTASGIHPRFAKYYIRRVRQDKKDPLSLLMIEQGVPYVDDGSKFIFSFPIKSPDGSITNKDMNAIGQLKLWKIYRDYFCDGNPSQTIYYTDNTFLDVQSWVWKNWSSIGGLSFFPIDDHVYENAPYEEIVEDTYNKLVSEFPSTINWDLISKYELEDNTAREIEFACSGGNCEI